MAVTITATLPASAFRSRQEQRRLALHEAGHAVVAHIHGVQVTEVSLHQDGTTAGRTGMVASGAWEDPATRALILLAGPLAEGFQRSGPYSGPGCRDLVQLERIEPRWDEIYGDAAVAAVRRHREAIEAVAEDLRLFGRLDGRRLAALLGTADDRKV